MQTQSFKQSISRHLRSFVHRLFHNSANPAVVGRDHNHLASEYRRRLSSPIAAAQLLGKWIFADENVLALLQSNPATQPQLMRVAVIGDDIHINLYRLERFPGGPLTLAYNDNWIEDGIVDYVLTTSVELTTVFSEDQGVLQNYQHLTRPLQADLSYDFFEPYASLILPVLPNEMGELAAVATPAWKRLS